MTDLIKTEKEFDNFMEQMGYFRVSEDVGESPGFYNADYVNKRAKSIVELKIINKEFFGEGGIIDSLNAIILQPRDVDDQGEGQYTFTLPDINRKGKHDNFEEPLRRIIKKANRQIKETKSYYFSDSDSYGFLIVAQVGLSSLSPEITGAVIKKILDQEFKSIDGAIVCTPYFNLINPLSQEQNPECVSVTKDYDSEKKEMCFNMANKWINFYENQGHQ